MDGLVLTHEIREFSQTELLVAVVLLKPRKAPGLDGISCETVRHAGKIFLYNECMRTFCDD